LFEKAEKGKWEKGTRVHAAWNAKRGSVRWGGVGKAGGQ